MKHVAANENGRSMFVMIIWFFGLLLSSSACSNFSGIELWIPSINSFALAASEGNYCATKAMWLYSWSSFPLFALFFAYVAYRQPINTKRDGKRVLGLLFFVGVFLCITYVAYHGMYEPYPGDGGSRWEKFYRESILGVVLITNIIWGGVYASWYMCVTFVFEIMKITKS